MPSYYYSGRNQQGSIVSGTLDANSVDLAANDLIRKGVIPLKIEESSKLFSWSEVRSTIPFLNNLPSREELSMFCRQLYALQKAGVPLSAAIDRISYQLHNQSLVKAAREVAQDLQAGLALARALAKHPFVFSNLFCQMIAVGENTGQLEAALLQLSEYIELEEKTVKRIRAVVRYPLIVISAMMLAFGIITIWVIPVFAKFFERYKASLPAPTKFLISMSNFMHDYWWVVLLAIFGVIAAFKIYINDAKGRENWHRLQLRMPILGNILLRIMFARFTRLLAMVMKTDILLPKGLELTADAMGNLYLAKHIRGMRTDIAKGETLLKSATNTGLFSPLVLQMLAVGEETGTLDEMFEQVADFYEREIDYDLKKLNDAIEPILIVIMGIMVLILALGVFMPMWSMTQVVRRG